MRKKPRHLHYCAFEDHDHYWACIRDPCSLHYISFCHVCRCGRVMVEIFKPSGGLLDYRIFACPLRPDHLGHDSKVLESLPLGGRPPSVPRLTTVKKQTP